MRLLILLLLLSAMACDTTESNQDRPMQEKTYPTIGSIEVLDASLSTIIPADATIEILADGFTWSEGPVWVSQLDALLFSDVPENKIWKWSEADSLQLFLTPSGYLGKRKMPEPGSNGLLLNHEGELLICQHGERQVAKLAASYDDPKPEFTALATRHEGKRFNSPNDLVIDKAGNIYFTDPPYGLPEKMNDPEKEIPYQGVYRLNTDGAVDLLTKTMTRPNGIELSPDETILYVANSDPEKAYWLAFDITTDGHLTNERIFFDTTELVGTAGNAGLPDGFVVNQAGLLFATGPGGVWIINPEGEALGRILTTQATANCTLTPDESALYITADRYLLRVKL